VLSFRPGNAPPDLKQDFLIQVGPVGVVPRMNTGTPGSIPVDQSQKLLFVWRRIQNVLSL